MANGIANDHARPTVRSQGTLIRRWARAIGDAFSNRYLELGEEKGEVSLGNQGILSKINILKRKSGGAKGSRTPDLLNAIQALSQLSYGPTGGPAALGRPRETSREAG